MSQVDLAKEAELSLGTITSYEGKKNVKMPRLDTAERIARVLGVSLDWLCDIELDKSETISIPLALMSVIKKLKPRIEFDAHDGKEVSVKLIFDRSLYEKGVNADVVNNFLKDYSDVIAVENKKMLPDDMIMSLEKQLLEKYKHLPNLPNYTTKDA